MAYVDGFLLVIKKKHLKAYTKLATKAGKLWRELGAQDYYECVGDDMKVPFGISFPKRAGLKKDEVVIFSYIVYASKAVRNKVNTKIMKDKRMEAMMNDPAAKAMDMKRMSYGGFKTLVAMPFKRK